MEEGNGGSLAVIVRRLSDASEGGGNKERKKVGVFYLYDVCFNLLILKVKWMRKKKGKKYAMF